jgi:hypothetical protein
MAITCPKCGSQFDATLFHFGHQIRCRCGAEIEYSGTDLRAGHVLAEAANKPSTQVSAPDVELNVSADRSWEVWRQGDDGNPFLVKDGLSSKEADDMVSLFESRGHKQVYWKTKAKVK